MLLGEQYVPCIGGGEFIAVARWEVDLLHEFLRFLRDPALPLTDRDRLLAPVPVVAAEMLLRLARPGSGLDHRTLGRATAATLVVLGQACGRDPHMLAKELRAWQAEHSALLASLRRGALQGRERARAETLLQVDRACNEIQVRSGVLPSTADVLRAFEDALRRARGPRPSRDDLTMPAVAARFYEMLADEPDAIALALRKRGGRMTVDWSRIRDRVAEPGGAPRGTRIVGSSMDSVPAPDEREIVEHRDEAALARRVIEERRRHARARSRKLVLENYEALAHGRIGLSRLAKDNGLSPQALSQAKGEEDAAIRRAMRRARFSG